MTRDVETPSFTFRLERVRSLRSQAEAAAREELAQQLALRLRGEAMLTQAAAAAAGARRAGLHAVQRPGASGADFVAAQAFLERRERERREAALELDRHDAEVQARREALTEASREREVIDRLKERHRQAHRREWARRDQVEADEIALGVHRRGQATAA
jgi:flagellar FliJ protein